MRAGVRLERTYRGYRRSARKRRAWAAGNLGNVAIRAELLDAVRALAVEPLRGEGRVLDVGCGGGWLLERLTEHGVAEGRLYGVDLLVERAEVARRRVPGADVRLADARRLPHADGEFDLLTLLTCLSSLPDRPAVAAALTEAERVLAPGGLLLVYEPRLPNPFNRATQYVSPRLLHNALGPTTARRCITGFPPLTRRLVPLTPSLYGRLSRLAPTHALSAWRRDGSPL